MRYIFAEPTTSLFPSLPLTYFFAPQIGQREEVPRSEPVNIANQSTTD